MDEHPQLTSKSPTAQADIRDYFHSSPNTSTAALTTPSHPVPHVRARSDAAHDAMFNEWEAPVYKPTPRSKSDGYPIRRPPQDPQSDHACGQTVDLDQVPIISTRSQPSYSSAQIPAQTKNLTMASKVSRRSLDVETLSQVPLTLLGNTAVMDHSLVPKPLKLTSHHVPSPSIDRSTATARTDTSDSFMKSRVTSAHEKHSSDIDPSSTEIMSDGGNVLKGRRRITTKPVYLKPEFQSSRLTWDDEAVMYLLPSPALAPSVPEKARRILGTADDKSNVQKQLPVTQPDCEIYTGPAWVNECHTSRHRVETAQEIRLAKERSDKTSGTASKKKKKGGRLAKFIFGGAVDDRVA